MMLTSDCGQCGGPLLMVDSRSRKEWRLAGLASWLVKVENKTYGFRGFSAISKLDEMTSQAKRSSTAASATAQSTVSPAVATPQFITSLVQSTVQANTTSLLGQLDRRIAAALRTQSGVGSSPGRETQPSAQHQAPPPITSTPVAPVVTTPTQGGQVSVGGGGGVV